MTYVAVEKASVVVKRQSVLVMSGTLQQKCKLKVNVHCCHGYKMYHSC